MTETIGDQLNDLGDLSKRRPEYAFDTGTCVYCRPEVLLDYVLDLGFLLVDCCFKYVSFGLEHGKLTESVLQDLVTAASWLGCHNG
jgi:hypothetical protein